MGTLKKIIVGAVAINTVLRVAENWGYWKEDVRLAAEDAGANHAIENVIGRKLTLGERIALTRDRVEQRKQERKGTHWYNRKDAPSPAPGIDEHTAAAGGVTLDVPGVTSNDPSIAAKKLVDALRIMEVQFTQQRNKRDMQA